VCQEDRSVSHFTRKQRDDRYDLNQLRTEPWIPNQDERRVMTMTRTAGNRLVRVLRTLPLEFTHVQNLSSVHFSSCVVNKP